MDEVEQSSNKASGKSMVNGTGEKAKDDGGQTKLEEAGQSMILNDGELEAKSEIEQTNMEEVMGMNKTVAQIEIVRTKSVEADQSKTDDCRQTIVYKMKQMVMDESKQPDATQAGQLLLKTEMNKAQHPPSNVDDKIEQMVHENGKTTTKTVADLRIEETAQMVLEKGQPITRTAADLKASKDRKRKIRRARKLARRRQETKAMAFLAGVYSRGSPLSMLRGTPHIVEMIYLMATNENRWERCLKGKPSRSEHLIFHVWFKKRQLVRNLWKKMKAEVFLYLWPVGRPNFPPIGDGININMMPFRLFRDFERSHLPQYLAPYYSHFIREIAKEEREKIEHNTYDKRYGRVSYLTITEGLVMAGETPRPPGLHVIADRKFGVKDGIKGSIAMTGGGSLEADIELDQRDVCKKCHRCDAYHTRLIMNEHLTQGGIYISINVPDALFVYDQQVTADPVTGREVIGRGGSVEHLRGTLYDNVFMVRPNYYYWITDRTPLEWRPLKETQYVQYFQLVVGRVDEWNADTCTKNPGGKRPVRPNDMETRIVGRKFSRGRVKRTEMNSNIPKMKVLLRDIERRFQTWIEIEEEGKKKWIQHDIPRSCLHQY